MFCSFARYFSLSLSLYLRSAGIYQYYFHNTYESVCFMYFEHVVFSIKTLPYSSDVWLVASVMLNKLYANDKNKNINIERGIHGNCTKVNVYFVVQPYGDNSNATESMAKSITNWYNNRRITTVHTKKPTICFMHFTRLPCPSFSFSLTSM